MLAIALFGGAAALTLATVHAVLEAQDRARRYSDAVDLAKSRLSELDSGLISLNALRMMNPDVEQADDEADDHSWIVDLKTYPSEFTGLTLVEITVRERTFAGGAQGVSYSLRQLFPVEKLAGHSLLRNPEYQSHDAADNGGQATIREP